MFNVSNVWFFILYQWSSTESVKEGRGGRTPIWGRSSHLGLQMRASAWFLLQFNFSSQFSWKKDKSHLNLIWIWFEFVFDFFWYFSEQFLWNIVDKKTIWIVIDKAHAIITWPPDKSIFGPQFQFFYLFKHFNPDSICIWPNI